MANRPIHVMQLISSLEVGGAEKLLLDLLDSAREDNRIRFTVVVMNQSVNPEMKRRLDSFGLDVYYLNRPEGHFHLKYLRTLLQIVRRHQIDVIHSHNYGSKLWGMLCKLCCPSMKLVFTIHDTVPATFSPLQRFLHRTFIDQHIAISKSVDALCEREGFHKREQIYNGIDLAPFENPERLSWVERLKRDSFQEWPLHIVQVGRMHYPKKGQDLLIKAVEQCRRAGLNVKATLMGGVYEYSQSSFEELRQMVNNAGLESDVEFLVNRTDVPEVLKQADLFVLASRYEGLGLVVLEAMAAGVPVIASNIDGPAELIQDGQNGLLFKTNDAESLFEKIRYLHDHPAIADRFASEAIRFVKGFDIHLMKERYYQLYQRLLPERVSDLLPSSGYYESTPREVLNGTPV